MNIKEIILSICLVLFAASLSHGKEWDGIVPLQSTRADVERLLGPAKEPAKNYVSIHETEREVVLIEYSTGEPCSGGVNKWRVQRGTVLSIRVAPRAQIRFSELHIDESQYKETDGGHVPNYAYYTNDKEGVQVEVKQGLVMSISYFPGAKDEELRCPGSRSKQNYCSR
jgi:hypothetical protein